MTELDRKTRKRIRDALIKAYKQQGIIYERDILRIAALTGVDTETVRELVGRIRFKK